MKKTNKYQNQKGQTLFEVVITLLIIGLVLAGIVRVVIFSLKNAEYSRNQNLALNLAQSKIEDLRRERDSQPWSSFWSLYLPADPYVVTEAGLGLNNLFDRQTTFANPASPETNILEIEVVVRWQDSQGEHNSTIKTRLTEWR